MLFARPETHWEHAEAGTLRNSKRGNMHTREDECIPARTHAWWGAYGHQRSIYPSTPTGKRKSDGRYLRFRSVPFPLSLCSDSAFEVFNDSLRFRTVLGSVQCVNRNLERSLVVRDDAVMLVSRKVFVLEKRTLEVRACIGRHNP